MPQQSPPGTVIPPAALSAEQFRTAFEYGGFWRRAVASLVDCLWQLALIVALGYLFFGTAYFEGASEGTVAGFVVETLIPTLLILVFWFYRQATPGKMLLDMEIVDAQTGRPPTTRQYVLRVLGYIVSSIPLGLGFLWIIWDPKKQGWHDKIARTVVVRTPYA